MSARKGEFTFRGQREGRGGGETARLSVTDSSESDTEPLRRTNNNPLDPLRDADAKSIALTALHGRLRAPDIIYTVVSSFFLPFLFYFQFT